MSVEILVDDLQLEDICTYLWEKRITGNASSGDAIHAIKRMTDNERIELLRPILRPRYFGHKPEVSVCSLPDLHKMTKTREYNEKIRGYCCLLCGEQTVILGTYAEEHAKSHHREFLNEFFLNNPKCVWASILDKESKAAQNYYPHGHSDPYDEDYDYWNYYGVRYGGHKLPETRRSPTCPRARIL